MRNLVACYYRHAGRNAECFERGSGALKSAARRDGPRYVVLRQVLQQLARTEERLVAQTLEPVERRVADYLMSLPARPTERGLLVELPLPKKDVASYLGTSPESLSRSLRALAQAGIIETRGAREVLVVDSFALGELTT